MHLVGLPLGNIDSWKSGFSKLDNPKAKANKTLFGAIKPTNPSVWMAYKGQIIFGKPGKYVLYKGWWGRVKHVKGISVPSDPAPFLLNHRHFVVKWVWIIDICGSGGLCTLMCALYTCRTCVAQLIIMNDILKVWNVF